MSDGRPAYMQQQQHHHREDSGTSGSSAGAAAPGHSQTQARGRGRAAACLEVEVLEDTVYAVFLAPLQVGLQGPQSDWGSGYRRGTGLRHTRLLAVQPGKEGGDAWGTAAASAALTRNMALARGSSCWRARRNRRR